MSEHPPALSVEEFASLLEVSKGEAQREIPQLHWERLVGLGYAVRRLGELGLTASGILVSRRATSHFPAHEARRNLPAGQHLEAGH